MINKRTLIKSSAALAAVSVAAPFIRPSGARADDNVVKILGLSTVALTDWTEFEKSTGLKIDFEAINSDPGLYIQEVAANGAGDTFDIFMFDGGIENYLGSKGYLKVIDESAMPLWKDIPDSVKRSNLLQTPDGTQYGVPIVFNADSFGYYVDDVDAEEPLSWSWVFESEKTLGKVAVEDTWQTTLPNAAAYLAVSKGMDIPDPGNMTPEQATKVVDFLIERKKAGQFRAVWQSYEESVDLLMNREVIVQQCWEPVVKDLQRKGKNIRYAYTKEGYCKWMIGAYLPSQADGDRLARAYKALNWFLGPQYSAAIAINQGYCTANPMAALTYAKEQSMPEASIAAIQENIEKIEKKFSSKLYWTTSSPDHQKEIEEQWQRFKQA